MLYSTAVVAELREKNNICNTAVVAELREKTKNRIDEVYKFPCENETKSTELIYN